jgi:hypothetical protein
MAAPRLMRAVGKSEERALALFDVLEIPLASDSGISISLPPQTLQACIRIGGRVFAPRTEPPRGLVGRMSGMQTEISELIMVLSNDVSSQAADALTQLLNDSELRPWRPHLQHALATQQKKMRDAEFHPPSAADVARALSTGSPVSSADLHELICETFNAIRDAIRNASTDGYKAFWNTDGHRWTPKREGECRDRLKEHLDSHLRTHGVAIEAEALHADAKRADLKVSCGGWSIPVEIKRHFHRDLWTAPSRQLAKRYARDPAAHHRGVYVVVWFGPESKPVPRAPKGAPPARDCGGPEGCAGVVHPGIPAGSHQGGRNRCIASAGAEAHPLKGASIFWEEHQAGSTAHLRLRVSVVPRRRRSR